MTDSLRKIKWPLVNDWSWVGATGCETLSKSVSI